MGDKARGLNALFGDGHVNFSTNEEAFADNLWPDGFNQTEQADLSFRTILSKLEP